MRIGLVGLGRMGSAISIRLHEFGFDVVAWDQNSSANNAVAKDGLRIAASPAAVAQQSDFIISIITEDHGVRRIFTGSLAASSSSR